jgi:hypothetical protein
MFDPGWVALLGAIVGGAASLGGMAYTSWRATATARTENDKLVAAADLHDRCCRRPGMDGLHHATAEADEHATIRKSVSGRTATLVALAALLMPTMMLAASTGAAAGSGAGRHRNSTISRLNTFTQPLWTADIGTNVEYSSPTFATIDGVRAIVAASLSGEVYVVNAITGKELPGWPQPVDIVGKQATAIDSSPVVAYLDGPSKPPSIIVGAGSKAVANQNGGLIAFYASGKVRFVFHTISLHQGGVISKYDDDVFASPAVGDIQGNGEQDIVFGAFDHRIYAVTPAGKLVPGFPIQRDDATWASAVLADTTHTGRDDIIVGSAASGYKQANGQPCIGGWVLDYRYDSVTHTPQLIWSQCVGESVWSSATVGVINPGPSNPTNEPAVVVGTSFDSERAGTIEQSDKIYAFYANNGKALPGWPVIAPHPAGTTGATFSSPVIAQVTPGGPPVVISASCACIHGPSVLSEWNGAGHLLWTIQYNPHNNAVASPAVLNVTGSGPNDILIGDTPGVYIFSAADGSPIDGTDTNPLQDGCRVDGTPAVSEVPQVSPSGYELAFSCERPGSTQAVLVAYPLPAKPDQAIAWGEWRGDPLHTGISDPPSGGKLACSPSAKPTGYRLIRADGRILTFGSLGNCGGLSTQVLPSPVIGMTSTADGGGYFVALRDGKVYAFGDALWRGDVLGPTWTGPTVPPGAPIVGFAAVANGEGYYLLDGEGHLYAFGAGAPYLGSPASVTGMPVSIVTNPAGSGYWVVTSTGNVYSFGADKLSSVAGPTAVVAAAATPDGKGLWMVSSNGAIHTTGDAKDFGSPRNPPPSPIVGLAVAPGGAGYWMVESGGTVDAFPWPGLSNYGSGTGQSEPIVAISAPGS